MSRRASGESHGSDGSHGSTLSVDSFIEELERIHGENSEIYVEFLNTVPEFPDGDRSVVEARKYHSQRAKQREANGQDGQPELKDSWTQEMRERHRSMKQKQRDLGPAKNALLGSLKQAKNPPAGASEEQKMGLVRIAMEHAQIRHNMIAE